ncbi:hypothetical protein CR513_45587, partial [Mucuna pruriens]
MSYAKLMPHLILNSLIVTVPLKPVQPPYPKSYNYNAKCEYHAGVVGHATKKCWGLKYKVQDLIDMRWLSFKEHGQTLATTPSQHMGTLQEAKRIQTPMKFVFKELLKHKMILEKSVKTRELGLRLNGISPMENYKKLLQELMYSSLVQVYRIWKGEGIAMAQEEN